MSDDPTFEAEVQAAQAYYRDLLEWESVNLARRRDNPLPYFARLKAELPSRYIDRQAILLATGSDLPVEDGKLLLHAMLGQHGQPAMQAIGEGDVLPPADAEPSHFPS